MATGLEGVRELTAKLTELGAKTAAKELKGTVKTAMGEAEHVARATMPTGDVAHLTYRGRLVSPGYALTTLHIEVRINKKNGSAEALLGVGREAFYVVQFVELGTSKMPAQPWLRPAFEASQDAVLNSLASELRERVERIAKKRKGG